MCLDHSPAIDNGPVGKMGKGEDEDSKGNKIHKFIYFYAFRMIMREKQFFFIGSSSSVRASLVSTLQKNPSSLTTSHNSQRKHGKKSFVIGQAF
jgi:hypothetical protein